jgi:hypothetical protein
MLAFSLFYKKNACLHSAIFGTVYARAEVIYLPGEASDGVDLVGVRDHGQTCPPGGHAGKV